MDLKRITGKAKDLVEKRGGTDSLKQDAEELKGIAKGQGSFADKAKAAASALKDPGQRGASDTPATAEAPVVAEASTEERKQAEKKVKGEHRGKHAQGRGGRKREGRDSDPAV